MALSKPSSSFFSHLKTLAHPHTRRRPPPSFLSFRFLSSYASPEEAAAADRRRRKRQHRMEPPLNSLRHSPQQQQQQQRPQPPSSAAAANPNAPKLPEPVSALSGNRLNLHNRILGLIRDNDLEEAALLTRHSIYSNCRPTIFTVNAVLAAQLRQCRYADLLTLHRFITQASVAPNLITHNLLLSAYCDCRKSDTALEFYKQLLNDAPFNPSPTTYRILTKGLVLNDKLDRALSLKEEMLSKGFSPDPTVYHHLMSGHVKASDPDAVFALFEELKAKSAGTAASNDGIVYGNLIKAYFLKGLEKEAMECYESAVGAGSKVKMSAMAFNSVLEALCKNGKFGEALGLFDRIKAEHNPPMRLAVNLGTFNVMVDGYCSNGRFREAIEVFRSMGEKRCSPDAMSYNNLIDQLCSNGLLPDAEELYGEMMDGNVAKPDEYTYVLLMDACFKANRPDDAAAYFRKMVDTPGLRPNLAVYNKLVRGLVDAGKVDEAKSFYDLMVKKLKMDDASYEFMMNEMFKLGRSDEVLRMASNLLDDEGVELSTELQEFIKGQLAKEGRGEDLGKLIEEKERAKEEARQREIAEAEAAKASARAAVASLIPGKLFGKKDEDSADSSGNAAEQRASVNGASGNVVESASVNGEAQNGEQEISAGASQVESGPVHTDGLVEEATVIENAAK